MFKNFVAFGVNVVTLLERWKVALLFCEIAFRVV